MTRLIDEMKAGIKQAEAQATLLKEEIALLQNNCLHTYEFSEQINNYSEAEWIKIYKCSKCDFEMKQIGRPVCEECHGDATLMVNKLKASQKPTGHSPQRFVVSSKAFGDVKHEDCRIRGAKCCDPNCGVISLLWVNGD